MTRDDIELAFIREFQVLGAQLDRTVSFLERCERVRVAIYREQRQAQPFHGSGMTYAEAYREWAGSELEKRAKPRPVPPVPLEDATDDLDEPHAAGA